MPPSWPLRAKPSSSVSLYHCSDCQKTLRKADTVKWDSRFLCTDCATARGLAP